MAIIFSLIKKTAYPLSVNQLHTSAIWSHMRSRPLTRLSNNFVENKLF